MMQTRVATIAIVMEDPNAVEQVYRLLHEAADHILGRMGLPYRERGINLISVAIDAPQDVISALSGKIGALPGVSAKTAYSNIVTAE